MNMNMSELSGIDPVKIVRASKAYTINKYKNLKQCNANIYLNKLCLIFF